MGDVTITLEEFYYSSTEELFSKYCKDKGNNLSVILDVDGNTTFSALAYRDKKYIWSHNGSVVVSMIGISSYEQLKDRCLKSANGAEFCGRCGKEITGRINYFFAGRYCSDCWTDRDRESRDWYYSHLD